MAVSAPYSLETSGNGSRRLDIQGLRAVAVCMVVAFHAGLPVPGGFVGVDVFFVISGFVITGMLQREWATAGRIDFLRFYVRRFKRLTPALALMVSVVVLISALALSPLGTQQTVAETAIGAMLLVANVVIQQNTGGYFDAPAETNPLLNTWSLSVEEQFYLAFPALIALGWLIARQGRARKLAPYLLVGVTAGVSFGLAVLTSRGWTPTGAPWLLGFYSSFTRAWEFAAGALLALALTRRTPKQHSAAVVLGLLGIVMVGASLWTITGATPFPGAWTLLPVSGTLLVLLAGADDANPVSRVLAARPMAKIGDWSYSIYLWHWPFIVFAGLLWRGSQPALLGAVVLSSLPALASYRWVEQPLRGVQIRGPWRMFAMVLGTVTIPIVLAVGMDEAATRIWIPRINEQQVRLAKDVLAPPIGYAKGCHYGSDVAGPPGVCRWNGISTGEPVYLVGDSNAAHFTEGIREATTRTGQPLTVSTASSCPMLVNISLAIPSRANHVDVCREYVGSTTAWLSTAEPGVVVLAASDGYWLDSVTGVTEAGRLPALAPAVKIPILQEALERTINSLEDAGHRVVLVQTVPHWADDWNLASCTLAETLSGCVQSMPTSSSESRSQAVRSTLRLVGQRTDSTVLDLVDAVCPEAECMTRRDGRWIYRDSNHLTSEESKYLAPFFVGVLGQR